MEFNSKFNRKLVIELYRDYKLILTVCNYDGSFIF